MPKLTLAVIVLAGITALSNTAIACSSGIGPTYIGDRSANPEQETYGCVVMTGSQHLLGFVGPARHVGAVTADVERNTIAYRPLLGIQRNGFWSFGLEEE